MKKKKWLLVQEKCAKRKKRHPRNQPSFKHLLQYSSAILDSMDILRWWEPFVVETKATKLRPYLAGAFYGTRGEIIRKFNLASSFLKWQKLIVVSGKGEKKRLHLACPTVEFIEFLEKEKMNGWSA